MGKEFTFKRQPFDGSQKPLSPKAQQSAAAVFARGFDGLLKQHSDRVHPDFDNVNWTRKDSLTLASPTEDSTKKVLLSFEREISLTSGNVFSRELEVDEEDTHQHYLFYWSPSAVRRDDSTSDLLPDPEPNEDRIANKKLAAQFGFNEQPVTTDEVKSILQEAKEAPPLPMDMLALGEVHDNPEENQLPREAAMAAELFVNYISEIMEEYPEKVVALPDGRKKLEWLTDDDGLPTQVVLVATEGDDQRMPTAEMHVEQNSQNSLYLSFEVVHDLLVSKRMDSRRGTSTAFVYPHYIKLIKNFIKDHPFSSESE